MPQSFRLLPVDQALRTPQVMYYLELLSMPAVDLAGENVGMSGHEWVRYLTSPRAHTHTHNCHWGTSASRKLKPPKACILSWAFSYFSFDIPLQMNHVIGGQISIVQGMLVSFGVGRHCFIGHRHIIGHTNCLNITNQRMAIPIAWRTTKECSCFRGCCLQFPGLWRCFDGIGWGAWRYETPWQATLCGPCSRTRRWGCFPWDRRPGAPMPAPPCAQQLATLFSSWYLYFWVTGWGGRCNLYNTHT